MQWEQLAIHGTPHIDGVPRVEICLDGDGEPELLHGANGGGRFARVIRGYVRAGNVPQAVAFKLERDEPLEGGAVKFINEYVALVCVHQNLPRVAGSCVVQMVEMWGLSQAHECDELPPTILCRKRRRVLPPRCPTHGCRKPLSHELRCLYGCDAAPNGEILNSSRCPECSDTGDCGAYWLNKRTCKLLLLELLDVDLEDYLRWRWTPPTDLPTHRLAWTKFEKEHMAAVRDHELRIGGVADPVATQVDEMRFLLGLFTDAMTGVRELHNRGIPHLDLKPSNLCLAMDGISARLKIIDLGQAVSPGGAGHDWLESICSDAKRGLRGGLFWAPEQLPERFHPVSIQWRHLNRVHELTIDASEVQKLDIIPGDFYCFPPDGPDERFVVIHSVRVTASGYEIIALPVDANNNQDQTIAWPTTECKLPRQELRDGCLIENAGYAADVFALGILLVHIICRGTVDLLSLRSNLESLSSHLRSVIASFPSFPARFAAETVGRIQDAALRDLWTRFSDVFPEQSQLREIHLELLGIALRAIARGIPHFSYAMNRGDGKKCLDRFFSDVQTVRNRLHILLQAHELYSGRVARFRRSGLDQLLKWIEVQTRKNHNESAPPYDREKITHTLDMLSPDSERNQREFQLLLWRYHGNVQILRTDLGLFARELGAHLEGAREIHPVVRGMFDAISPPAPDTQQRLHALCATVNNPEGQRFAIALKELETAQKKLAIQVNFLRRQAADFRRAGGLAILAQPDVDRIEEALLACSTIAASLLDCINPFCPWLTSMQKNHLENIDGWNRLDLGGTERWVEFGRRVAGFLHKENQQAADWIERAKDLIPLVTATVGAWRSEVIKPWLQEYEKSRRTAHGLLLRFLAFLMRRHVSMRLNLSAEQSGRLTNPIDKLQNQVARIWPVPFEARMLDYFTARSPRNMSGKGRH